MYSAIGSGVIETHINSSTPVPGGSGTFSGGIGDVYRSGNAETFLGGQGGSFLGWYRWTPTGVNAIVTTSTPVPGGSGNFTTWGTQALANDRLVFSARNATTRGVYSRDASGTGPISIIADTSTIVPGTSTPFAGFTQVAAEGSSVAFLGGPANLGGVWAYLNNQLTKVIDTNAIGPSGEQFQLINALSVSGNNVAFLADTSAGPEILVWRNGTLSTVVKYGDVINGITVRGLTLTSQSLRGDTVAFTFNTFLGAGPVSGGVYTATYIPSPGAFLALTALAIPRRRRS